MLPKTLWMLAKVCHCPSELLWRKCCMNRRKATYFCVINQFHKLWGSSVYDVPFRAALTHCQCLSVSDVTILHIDVILPYGYYLWKDVTQMERMLNNVCWSLYKTYNFFFTYYLLGWRRSHSRLIFWQCLILMSPETPSSPVFLYRSILMFPISIPIPWSLIYTPWSLPPICLSGWPMAVHFLANINLLLSDYLENFN
jgi:hypothetical protein